MKPKKKRIDKNESEASKMYRTIADSLHEKTKDIHYIIKLEKVSTIKFDVDNIIS